MLGIRLRSFFSFLHKQFTVYRLMFCKVLRYVGVHFSVCNTLSASGSCVLIGSVQLTRVCVVVNRGAANLVTINMS